MQVPEFRVSYTVTTDALDALYKKLKPKGVTMTALLAKAAGVALASHPVLFAGAAGLTTRVKAWHRAGVWLWAWHQTGQGRGQGKRQSRRLVPDNSQVACHSLQASELGTHPMPVSLAKHLHNVALQPPIPISSLPYGYRL